IKVSFLLCYRLDVLNGCIRDTVYGSAFGCIKRDRSNIITVYLVIVEINPACGIKRGIKRTEWNACQLIYLPCCRIEAVKVINAVIMRFKDDLSIRIDRPGNQLLLKGKKLFKSSGFDVKLQ